MDITFTIPDAVASRAINALASAFAYQSAIDGQPNPETKAQFVKRSMAARIKAWIVEGEANAAALAARKTAEDSAKQIAVT